MAKTDQSPRRRFRKWSRNYPTKSARPRWVHRKMSPNRRDHRVPVSYKFFQKQKGKKLQNSFYESSITLVLQPEKKSTKKVETNHLWIQLQKSYMKRTNT